LRGNFTHDIIGLSKENLMIISLLAPVIIVALIALYTLPSYSEGHQMINGGQLYSNQTPKLK
jgi:hypothetical protein